MSLITVLVAVIPKWRKPAIGWVVLADAIVVVIAFVTKESGEGLEEIVGESAAIEHHSQFGDVLPLFALGLLVAAILVWIGSRTGGILLVVAIVLTFVAAIAATGMTVVTGDTGARAVWSEDVAGAADQPADVVGGDEDGD